MTIINNMYYRYSFGMTYGSVEHSSARNRLASQTVGLVTLKAGHLRFTSLVFGIAYGMVSIY